jgi:hypothetical protein
MEWPALERQKRLPPLRPPPSAFFLSLLPKKNAPPPPGGPGTRLVPGAVGQSESFGRIAGRLYCSPQHETGTCIMTLETNGGTSSGAQKRDLGPEMPSQAALAAVRGARALDFGNALGSDSSLLIGK